MGRVDDKVVIITGAASGQGKEEARLFASEGAKVVATDVQEEALTKVVEEYVSASIRKNKLHQLLTSKCNH